MQIIPVIDLKGGLVVHAVRGERKAYQAIDRHSGLTRSTTLAGVVADFLSLFPFQTFYIADLDAITSVGSHGDAIDKLCARFPAIEFWIDNGQDLSAETMRYDNQTVVIGTESQTGGAKPVSYEGILSLDFKNGELLGCSEWFERSDYWPKRVIAMTLQKVGTQTGPDFALLTHLRKTSPQTHFIAAGGIRGYDDLCQLSGLGIQSALVATALHSGALDSLALQTLQAKKYPGKPGYF